MYNKMNCVFETTSGRFKLPGQNKWEKDPTKTKYKKGIKLCLVHYRLFFRAETSQKGLMSQGVLYRRRWQQDWPTQEDALPAFEGKISYKVCVPWVQSCYSSPSTKMLHTDARRIRNQLTSADDTNKEESSDIKTFDKIIIKGTVCDTVGKAVVLQNQRTPV